MSEDDVLIMWLHISSIWRYACCIFEIPICFILLYIALNSEDRNT